MWRRPCSRRIAAVVTTIIPLVAAPVILALGLAARGIDLSVTRIALEANLAFGTADAAGTSPVLDLANSSAADSSAMVSIN